MKLHLFSQVLPTILGVGFLTLNLLRMRTLRQYLTNKPKTADPGTENTHPLRIGIETIYVTEQQYKSIMRGIYFSFFLLAMIMFSIIIDPCIYLYSASVRLL